MQSSKMNSDPATIRKAINNISEIIKIMKENKLRETFDFEEKPIVIELSSDSWTRQQRFPDKINWGPLTPVVTYDRTDNIG
jgi:hypothetical protein